MLSDKIKVKKTKSREELREERIAKHVEALKESESKIGQLFPVIESQFGVVSGSKRLKANPDWRKKVVVLKDEYEHWKAVANSNVQLEPSKGEWATWVNNAIRVLKNERKMSNADIVKKLNEDFGLPRYKIYELMDDEFKIEYKKLTTQTPKDDESKDSGLQNLKEIKVPKGMSDLELEKLLISELEKVGVKPEVKFAIDRPYNYTKPYFGDIKVGNVIMDVAGKSSKEEVEERDKYFILQTKR